MGPRQEVAFKSKNEIFRRLANVGNVASLTPAERRSYDADVKNARDTLNQIRGAFLDGEKKGRAEEKLNMARKMISNGWAPEMISSLTGLPLSEIQSL